MKIVVENGNQAARMEKPILAFCKSVKPWSRKGLIMKFFRLVRRL